MRSYLIQKEAGERCYAPISYLWVAGNGGAIMAKDYHSVAQHSYSPSVLFIDFIPPVLVHQCMHYTHDIHYNIPSDWLVYNSSSRYMDYDGWLKAISHLFSVCWCSPIKPQVLFCGVHNIHFDDRKLNILCFYHIQSLTLRVCDSIHDHPNDNGPNLNIKSLYDSVIINWMRKHGTLKFILDHMDDFLVKTW